MRRLVVVLAGCSFQAQGRTGTATTDGNVGADGPRDATPDTPDGPPDAPPDAPAFDPNQCPTEYTNTAITASPQSRYRLISTQATFATQHADCNDDHFGWTHLVVLDSALEGQQIRASITQSVYFAGAVQARDQADPAAGWVLFTGGTLPAETWQGGQPNDNNGGENNEQNFVAADDSSGLLNDISVATVYQYRAVCECDGLAIPQAVADLITASAP